jgi:hypothetical protein
MNKFMLAVRGESRFSPLTTPHRGKIFVLKQIDAKKYSPGIAVCDYVTCFLSIKTI